MNYLNSIKNEINYIKQDDQFILYLDIMKFDWYEKIISQIQHKIIQFIKNILMKLSEYILISDFKGINTFDLIKIFNRKIISEHLKYISKEINVDDIINLLDNVFTFAIIKQKNNIIKEKIHNLKEGYNKNNLIKYIDTIIKKYRQNILSKKKNFIKDFEIISQHINTNPTKNNYESTRNRILEGKKYYIKRPRYTTKEYYSNIDHNSILLNTISKLKNFCYLKNIYQDNNQQISRSLIIIMNGLPIYRIINQSDINNFRAWLFLDEQIKIAELMSTNNKNISEKLYVELISLQNSKEKSEIIKKYFNINYLKQLIKSCNQDIILIPIMIIYNYKNAHSNALVINKLRKEIEFYEPQYDINYPSNESDIDAIKIYLHDLKLNDYKLISSKKMSLFGGKKGVQSYTYDFNCVAWSYYYFFLRSIYPSKPSQVIELMTKGVRNPYFKHKDPEIKILKKRNPDLYYAHRYFILNERELERRILNFIYWFNKLDKKIGKNITENNKEKLIEIIDSALFEFKQFGGNNK